MTSAEYIEARNDPRQPIGLWGPRGGPAAYRIEGECRPAPVRPAPPRVTTAATHDHVAEFRLEQHRKAAEADKVIARLRRLR